MPRTGYLGIVTCVFNGQRVYIAPVQHWSGYNPKLELQRRPIYSGYTVYQSPVGWEGETERCCKCVQSWWTYTLLFLLNCEVWIVKEKDFRYVQYCPSVSLKVTSRSSKVCERSWRPVPPFGLMLFVTHLKTLHMCSNALLFFFRDRLWHEGVLRSDREMLGIYAPVMELNLSVTRLVLRCLNYKCCGRLRVGIQVCAVMPFCFSTMN